jgi:hypothetical protein
VTFGPTVKATLGPDFTAAIDRAANPRDPGVLGKRLVCQHASFRDNRLNPTGTMNAELDQDAGATNHNSCERRRRP